MIKNKLETYFETIKCNDYEVFNLEYHKNRIARTIGLNIDLEEYIYPVNEKLLKCKLTYNKDGILDIKYTEYTQKQINKFKIVIDNNITYKYKSTNRTDIDKLYSKRDDCDEIIIVKNNYITDTSIANIAILIKNIWYTPKKTLLDGITRERYLHMKQLVQRDIDIKLLFKAEKIALMNAMIDFKIIDEFSLVHQ